MFMMWYIILLMKDSFVSHHVKMAELSLEKQTSNQLRHAAINLQLVKLSLVFFFVVFVHFTFFVYLGFAIKHDHFMFPTFIMIAWMVTKTIRAFIIKKKKQEETLEVAQERLKQAYITEAKHWRRIAANLIYIWYFIYMLVMILFY